MSALPGPTVGVDVGWLLACEACALPAGPCSVGEEQRDGDFDWVDAFRELRDTAEGKAAEQDSEQ